MSDSAVPSLQEKSDCVRKRKSDFSSDEFEINTKKTCKNTEDEKAERQTSFAVKIEEKHQNLGLQEVDSDVDIKELMSEIKMYEERLRKLKMTKMYRDKNNLEELGDLIDKWRSVSQQALFDLLELHPSPQPSMTDLLNHLQIDFELIQFNQEDGSFE